MTLKIDLNSIQESIGSVKKLADDAFEASRQLNFGKIGSTYSAQMDYSHMGDERGKFINGGVGSAAEVVREYIKQIDWVHENLSTNAHALFGQDEANGRALDVADAGGEFVSELVKTGIKPVPRYDDLMMQLPLMIPEEPHAMFAKMTMSQDQQAVAASLQWAELATKIGQVSAGLTNIANQIEASNEGAVISAMLPVFREIAQQGSNFAINAISMTGDLGQLVESRNRVEFNVRNAVADINKAPTPEAKAAMTGVKSGELLMQLRQEMNGLFPEVKNLMGAPKLGISVQEAIEIGQGLINGNGKLNTDGLGAIGPGISRIAQLIAGDGDFNQAQQGATTYGGRSASEVATQATSLGSPTLASASTAPTVGGGMPAAAGAGAGTGGVGGVQSATGVGTALAGGAAPAGVGAASAAGNAARGVSMMPGMGMMGAAGAGAGAAGAGAGAGRAGRMSGSVASGVPTAGRGAGMGLAGMPGAVGAAGAPAGGVAGAGSGGVPRVVAPVSGVGPSAGVGASMAAGGAGVGAGSAGAGGVRGGGPMMGGMPMGAAGGKRDGRGKVKRITSAIERDDNVAALLGEREGVVPGVIGAWVRD